MNKFMRLAIVIIALLVIAVIAGSNIAWAKPGASIPAAQPAAPQQAAPAKNNVGSVEAPPCDVLINGNVISANICGIAELNEGSPITYLKAETSPRQGDFLSKTIILTFTSGSIELCFATVDGGGTIYYQPFGSTTWEIVPTAIENGLACAAVSLSGSYAFGK